MVEFRDLMPGDQVHILYYPEHYMISPGGRAHGDCLSAGIYITKSARGVTRRCRVVCIRPATIISNNEVFITIRDEVTGREYRSQIQQRASGTLIIRGMGFRAVFTKSTCYVLGKFYPHTHDISVRYELADNQPQPY